MTMAITGCKAYGIEVDEATTKRFKQFLEIDITGANTDVDYDLGDAVAGSLGTFWTAAGGSTEGAVALAAIRDIQTRARIFLGVLGLGLTHVQADGTVPVISKLDSDATAGGGATETLAVTGLLTTDTILGVSQFEKGAGTKANMAVVDYGDASGNCTVAGQLPIECVGDPGAGAKFRVSISRNVSTVASGTYQLSAGALALVPNILFLSGNAPTAMKLLLCWELNDEQPAVEAYAA